ncbi:MAG: hypothetical protein RSD95_13170 [Clostridia bacterium]
MKSYYLDLHSRAGYQTIPQEALRQYALPNPSKHPACWDAVLDKDGTMIFSECSELTTGEIAKLSRYDPKANRHHVMFALRNYVFPGQRTIRDSKVHTSMSWMNDGRLVMVSHTTDKSPAHPAWLPSSYYNHVWEGFPGSSLLLYDPKMDKLENLGIPVPRESLYGGVYDKIKNRYYAIGFLRGHLYGIDLSDRTVTDHGQVTEWGSYRLVVGCDDNIYFTTRNGLLQRVNVRAQKVENLRIQLPFRPIEGRLRPYISCAVNGPDGKLYMAGMHDDRLSCYDVRDGSFTILGCYMAAEAFLKDEPANVYVGSMGFDKTGVLYYTVCCNFRKFLPDTDIPVMLHRWDVMRGGKPEAIGLVGTPLHIVTTTCNMLMDHESDRMYIIGSNHGLDSPDIVTVNMDILRKSKGQSGETVTDPYTVLGNSEYRAFGDIMRAHNKAVSENTPCFEYGKMIPVRLWEQFDDEEMENSSVYAISFVENKLHVFCGVSPYREFTVSLEGKILECRQGSTDGKKHFLQSHDVKGLPLYPGRNYQARASIILPCSNGRRICATEDGLIAIEQEGHWFSVGPAWPNGPVNDMAVTADGKHVFGVAGDPEDINIVFAYDDLYGLRYLGPVIGKSTEYGESRSSRLTAIAVNQDASVIAIGAGGRMGTLYIYTIDRENRA